MRSLVLDQQAVHKLFTLTTPGTQEMIRDRFAFTLMWCLVGRYHETLALNFCRRTWRPQTSFAVFFLWNSVGKFHTSFTLTTLCGRIVSQKIVRIDSTICGNSHPHDIFRQKSLCYSMGRPQGCLHRKQIYGTWHPQTKMFRNILLGYFSGCHDVGHKILKNIYVGTRVKWSVIHIY